MEDKIKLEKALNKCNKYIYILKCFSGATIILMLLSIIILIWFSWIISVKIFITSVILIIILSYLTVGYEQAKTDIHKKISDLQIKQPMKSGGFMRKLEEAMIKQDELKNNLIK